MEFLTVISFPGLVALSTVILVVHVMLQAQLAMRDVGSEWNAGPRDEKHEITNKIAGRAERASKNFRETYPGFVALGLALAIADPASVFGYAGALVWIAARVVYIPLYLAGIPYIRSFVWLVSMLGLLMMLAAVLF